VSDLSDDFVRVQDGRRVCVSCLHHSRHLEDGWCPRCNGEAEGFDHERQARAIKKLHADTAEMLRRMGEVVEAEWHERRAR
jgi:hypothetical protein